jgi:hypothetical protein
MSKDRISNKKNIQKAKIQATSSVAVLSAPSESDLRPNDRERRLLKDLFDWQQRSARSHWVLGQARSLPI